MANMAYPRHKISGIPQPSGSTASVEELQRQIEFILGATKTGLDIIDSNYNLVYVDPEWAKLYGDYHGRKCYAYFMGKRAACPECGVRKALETKKIVVTEEVLVKENNRPIQVTTIPFQDERGRWLVAEVNVDIAERKKAESALKDSGERYRVLYDSSRDAIMTLTPPDWVFTAGNPATVELFGAKDEKEFTSMAPWELSPKYQPDGEPSSVKAKRMIDTAMKNGSHFFEWTHKRVNGEPFAATVLLTRVKIRDEVFLQATVRDVSELKRAEGDLFRAKRLSDIGMLAATVAHELRNPLATIRAAIFNIKRKSRDPLIEGHLENMEKKIVESNRIINDLLFYSRIRLPKFEPVKLCAIMEECVGLSQERFKGYRVKLHKVCKIAKGTVIQADAVQLKELCHNILDNAYESLANKRGTIEVKAALASRKGFISIRVKDNGVGMSAESLKRILEPFFTTKVRGTGLGFSICNQIVRLHNGTMNVASKEGKGTTVTVTLPVSQRKP